jgi:pyruvate kinase
MLLGEKRPSKLSGAFLFLSGLNLLNGLNAYNVGKRGIKHIKYFASRGSGMVPRTKIICTLGPASSTENTLKRMMHAGMDVVRLNCSHGSHMELHRFIRIVRRINKKYRRGIKILLDLEGPRIRVGRLKGHKPILLKKMRTIWLKKGNFVGKGNLIPMDYEGPLSDMKGADHIFIDDGNICLKIDALERNRIRTRVIVGGFLKEHKGINIPGVHLSISDVTDKDWRDIQFGVREKVDMIAQSFVRSAGTIEDIKRMVKEHLPRCAIVAKIENQEGIAHIDDIIAASDGIMVARGDMGVSLPIWEVPVMQKRIIDKCNRTGTFSITATQMLENMTEHVRPTRAEVSDIAHAILDGTNYVMLSAESAVGEYPVEAVRMMNNVIKYTEKSKYYKSKS